MEEESDEDDQMNASQTIARAWQSASVGRWLLRVVQYYGKVPLLHLECRYLGLPSGPFRFLPGLFFSP